MKVWGIVATILLIVAIGLGGWLYIENRNLKSEKSKIESDFAASKTALEAKITAASKKVQVLSLFFSGADDQSTMLEAYSLVKEMNDATLTADWTAMQSSKPGDTSGDKMMQDLISAAAADLK